LAIDPNLPNVVYAAPGVFRTTDTGTTWSQLEATPTYSTGYGDTQNVFVSPASSGLLAHSRQGFRSIDQGMTFPLAIGPGHLTWPIVAGPASGATLYAAAGGTVYASPDDGVSWQPHPGPVPFATIVAFAVDPQQPEVLFAATAIYDGPPGFFQ